MSSSNPDQDKITLCASNECPPEVEALTDGTISVNGKAHTMDEFREFVQAMKDGRYDRLLV